MKGSNQLMSHVSESRLDNSRSMLELTQVERTWRAQKRKSSLRGPPTLTSSFQRTSPRLGNDIQCALKQLRSCKNSDKWKLQTARMPSCTLQLSESAKKKQPNHLVNIIRKSTESCKSMMSKDSMRRL